MPRLRSIRGMAARCFLQRVAFVLLLAVFLSPCVTRAQQPAVGRQKSPRLTTDDVMRPQEQPATESKEGSKPGETGKAGAAEAKPDQAKAAETKVSEEESSWRERVNKARERAKELERATEEAELRITALRNELGVSGQSPRYRNDVASELDQMGPRLADLRAQSRVAASDLAQLVEYGGQKGFTEGEQPKPTEDGKPNEQYYRSQLAKLNESLQSAQRRIQLYENRIRDIKQRIMINSGGRDSSGRSTGGDNFYNLQLQQDLEEAQQKFEEAQAAFGKAQTDLESLKEEARRAGVPPGLFR